MSFYEHQRFLSIAKAAFAAWNRHEAPRLGAALAFYTILSLSPLVIIVLALAGLIFSRSTAQAHLLAQVQGMIGPEGGRAVQSMLAAILRQAGLWYKIGKSLRTPSAARLATPQSVHRRGTGSNLRGGRE
jgi:uncharacterized BrkB/YihY/UPF0761 family membrane protein